MEGDQTTGEGEFAFVFRDSLLTDCESLNTLLNLSEPQLSSKK